MVNHPADPPAIHPSIFHLACKTIELVVAIAINLPLLVPYLLTLVLYGRPPTVPRLRQATRYLHHCFTVQPSKPHLTFRARLYIALLLLIKAAHIPIWGLAWQIDEILYGKQLNSSALDIIQPIFVISAGRSGSTQISRYIESDPHIEAPSILQCMLPFLWLWRLIPYTVGRFLTEEYVTQKIKAMLPPEALERHEMDPFRADTFDGVYWGCHYNYRALALGPDLAYEDMNMAKLGSMDANDKMDDEFANLVDRIGRKHLLLRNMQQCLDPATLGEEETSSRIFFKGHFLWAADGLERRYPDASFLTVVREPTSRLRSGINFIRVQPPDPGLGPPPWSWLSSWLVRSEVDYCNAEMEFYSRRRRRRDNEDGAPAANRCVVTFDDFKSDLEMSMKKVYRECDIGVKNCDSSGGKLPLHVPRKHSDRRRSGYAVDKSLEELGIDEERVRTCLADYIDWCKSNSFDAKKN